MSNPPVKLAAQGLKLGLALFVVLTGCGRTVPLGGPEVDTLRSTVTVDRDGAVVADGVEKVRITVTLMDAAGRLLELRRVVVSVSGTENGLTADSDFTNASGVLTATLTSTRAELKRVTATIDPEGTPRALITRPSVTFIAGQVSPTASTLVASPTLLASDGVTASTLTATLRDAYGNATPGLSVKLIASGDGNLLTQPASLSDAAGVTTGTLAAVSAGARTVSAVVNPGSNQIALAQKATVTFGAGLPSTALSTVVAAPAVVAANGVATSTITVTVKDSQGTPIPGQTLRLTASGTNNTLVQPAGVTGANGVVTGTIASTQAEQKTVVAFVNPGPSQLALGSAQVTFQAGVVSLKTSTVVVSPPSVPADGFSIVTVTITTRDPAGNPVSGQAVGLAVSGSNNLVRQPPLTNASGVTVGTIASTRAETKTITPTITTGGAPLVLPQQTALFTPGPPSGVTSTLTASPPLVVADGVATSTVTITVLDANGNPLPGQTVLLGATGAGNRITQPGTTNLAGVTTATIASTRAETKQVGALINPGPTQVPINSVATLTFVAGKPSTSSTLTAAPTVVAADGVATSSLTVTVTDAFFNPVPGQTVLLSATGTNNKLSQPSSPTNARGIAVGTLASTAAEQKSITATINPGPTQVVVSQTARVTFVAGAVDPLRSTVVAAPTRCPPTAPPAPPSPSRSRTRRAT